MFDVIFDSMMAYQQVLMLIGGFVCLGLGILMAGNEIYWRVKAVHVAGIISGVRQKANIYYPVYRYQLPGGAIHESTSDIGSSGFAGKETGRMVPLMVFPDDPSTARPSGNWAFGIVGLCLMLPGLLLIYLAFARYPVTKMTWLMAVALFCYSGMKLQGILIPKGQRVTLATWKAAMKQKHEAEMQGTPVTRIEDAMTSDDGKKALAQQDKANRIAAPVMLMGGFLMLAGGVHIGNHLEILLQHGVAAKGQVVEMIPDTSGDGGSYAPKVSFADAQGNVFTFKDAIGQDPPEYRTGDSVDVLYLADDPEHSAIIDRGVMNYFLPGILLAMGTLFGIFGGILFRKTRKSRETAG